MSSLLPQLWRLTCAAMMLLLAAAAPIGAERPLNFETDILPIFARHGCNNSTCHGKAEGQNGFKLSVFGFDPEADYAALLMEGRGRRVFPGAPEHSLLLLKASGGLPHGGGVRILPKTSEYQTLRRWIADGTRFGTSEDPRPTELRLSHTHADTKLAPRQTLPLKAEVVWSDGRIEDVTHLATYQSNNDNLATVDPHGRVQTLDASGSVAVMASYAGHVAVCDLVIPRTQPIASQPGDWAARNGIDELIHKRLQRLNIEPSELCDDATFLRRASLDLIGTLPTSDEAREFLQDQRPDRRARLIEQLLERDEYADYWSQHWSDLLRVNRRVLDYKRAYQFHRWIHQAMDENIALDEMARQLIAANGPMTKSPAGFFYRSVPKPADMAATVSQVFLGVRIQCAQCHHHPWDRWGQSDYFGMQAIFSEVGFKSNARGDVLIHRKPPVTRHPRTKAVVEPRALGATQPLEPDQRRQQLAEWLTDDSNPFFARNMANRLWAKMMGRGLVEPVDDFRSTNPPSHPELLDHLADNLRAHDYDAKHLLKYIAASAAYQRATAPRESNQEDQFNYSRFPLKRLPAEVVLDAVCDVTGVPEKFAGIPAGSRAIELWDSHVPHYFLRLFGRPQRETACECERVSEPNVSQVLHLLNSPQLHSKMSHARGRIHLLSEATADDSKIIEELYLLAFSRFPTKAEQAALLEHIQTKSQADPQQGRRLAIEDIAWSLLNTLEFVLNH